MKKDTINSSNDRLLEKIVYNILLFLVNFFIDLGEATKFLLFLPIKIIIEIYKYVLFVVYRIYLIFKNFINKFINIIKDLIVILKRFFTKIKSFKSQKKSAKKIITKKKIKPKRVILVREKRFLYKYKI